MLLLVTGFRHEIIWQNEARNIGVTTDEYHPIIVFDEITVFQISTNCYSNIRNTRHG